MKFHFVKINKQYIITKPVKSKKVDFKNKSRKSNHFSILLAGFTILLLTSVSSIPSSDAGGGPSPSTLKITKIASFGDDTFDFIVTGPTSFNPSIATIGGTGSDGPTIVTAGTYSVQETIPAGWDLTTASCNDGSSTFSVDTVSGIVINAGSNVVCTFENIVSGLTVPDHVTGLVATATSDATIDLAWITPFDGGAPITGYQIERESPIGGGFTILVADTGSTSTTFEDSGLTSSTQYNYRVSAINGVGTGPASDESNDTTFAVPSTLKITKLTTGHEGTFDFIVTGPTSFNPSIATIGGTGSDGPTIVTAGTYSVQETIPAGWDLTTASCNDGSSTFSVDTVSGIVINEGDDIECTFENTATTLKITKLTTGGDGTFDFLVTGPTSFNPSILTGGDGVSEIVVHNTMYGDKEFNIVCDNCMNNQDGNGMIGQNVTLHGESITKIRIKIGGNFDTTTGQFTGIIMKPNQSETVGSCQIRNGDSAQCIVVAESDTLDISQIENGKQSILQFNFTDVPPLDETDCLDYSLPPHNDPLAGLSCILVGIKFQNVNDTSIGEDFFTVMGSSQSEFPFSGDDGSLCWFSENALILQDDADLDLCNTIFNPSHPTPASEFDDLAIKIFGTKQGIETVLFDTLNENQIDGSPAGGAAGDSCNNEPICNPSNIGNSFYTEWDQTQFSTPDDRPLIGQLVTLDAETITKVRVNFIDCGGDTSTDFQAFVMDKPIEGGNTIPTIRQSSNIFSNACSNTQLPFPADILDLTFVFANPVELTGEYLIAVTPDNSSGGEIAFPAWSNLTTTDVSDLKYTEGELWTLNRDFPHQNWERANTLGGLRDDNGNTHSDMLMSVTIETPKTGMSGPTVVAPGIYSVQETIPAGWDLTTASCNDGSSTFSVDTVSGIVINLRDNIECTFENNFSTLSPPDQITDLSVIIAGLSNIVLSWTAPADGGSPITGYQIERESPIGGGFVIIVADTGSTATVFNDLGLAQGTQYNYRVSAINAIGVGLPSNEADATTLTPPLLIEGLEDTVLNLNLPPSVETSLTGPLNQAIQLLTDGIPQNDPAVCGKLTAFINEVDAKEGNGDLTATEAQDLRDLAVSIQNSLGC